MVKVNVSRVPILLKKPSRSKNPSLPHSKIYLSY